MQENEALVEVTVEQKSNKIVICKGPKCFDMATINGFCRLHYISNWKRIKSKEAKKEGKDLNDYLEQLSARFPEEFFEKLRSELEEMSAAAEQSAESDDSSGDRGFDLDSDDDIETIIKGIRVEDF